MDSSHEIIKKLIGIPYNIRMAQLTHIRKVHTREWSFPIHGRTKQGRRSTRLMVEVKHDDGSVFDLPAIMYLGVPTLLRQALSKLDPNAKLHGKSQDDFQSIVHMTGHLAVIRETRNAPILLQDQTLMKHAIESIEAIEGSESAFYKFLCDVRDNKMNRSELRRFVTPPNVRLLF